MKNSKHDPIGSMAGTMEIVGDIVEPLGEDDWAVLQPDAEPWPDPVQSEELPAPSRRIPVRLGKPLTHHATGAG